MCATAVTAHLGEDLAEYRQVALYKSSSWAPFLIHFFRVLGKVADAIFSQPAPPSINNPVSATRQQELEQQRQQELERQQRALQEEMDRQEEARRQAEEAWLRERDKTYGMLKGPKLPDSLEMKGMKSANLDIKDIAPPSRDKRDLSTQWKRLHCATYLSEMADKASKQGKPDEASYLTEQAAQAMAGGELGVTCPDAPAPPTITQKAPGPPTPQEQFYTTLMQVTKVDLGKLQVAEKQLTEQKQKKEETEKKVEERRQEVQRLQQAPPLSNQPKSDSSMLAEAQRLLHEAEGEAAEATQALKNVQEQYKDAEATLQRDKGLFEQVQKNPQTAESALTQLKK